MGLPISKLAPLFAAIWIGTLLVASASAQAPAVAILEDIAGASGKHEAFDELKAGERLDLGASGRAVIGYLGSCTRETIDGGTVVIGEDRSQIEGGKVARETIPCEATQLVLSEAEAGTTATVTFRGPCERLVQQVLPSPSPVVLAHGETLKIKQLCAEDDRTVSVPLKDGHADLASANIVLVPGGYYELTAGKKQMVIKIDPTAEAGSVPVMSRLVRL